MDFNDTILAQIKGRSIKMAQLARFDFSTGTVRVHNGFGPLKTKDSNLWAGMQGMGRIGEIKQAINGDAPEQVFTLSGVDSQFISEAKAKPEVYYGRLCFIYFQFFDLDTNECLDMPVAVSWYRMYGLSVSMQPDEDTGGSQLSCSLSCETPFASRRRPAYGYYTDRDQQTRFPGDRGCERTAGIQQRVIKFPDY